eukprot:1003878-Rhodomonas_salina.1
MREDGKGGWKWEYGDGHLPYNPSPYKGFVDMRDMPEDEHTRADRLTEFRRAGGLGGWPVGQGPEDEAALE